MGSRVMMNYQPHKRHFLVGKMVIQAAHDCSSRYAQPHSPVIIIRETGNFSNYKGNLYKFNIIIIVIIRETGNWKLDFSIRETGNLITF